MRAIRRSDREISDEEARALLERAEYGILSTVGKDGQPYGVPLSFAYQSGGIYFHSALTGHKLDNIEHNAKVSFCVVGNTQVLPDQFATVYESAVVFGVASELIGTERYQALQWILDKYSPDFIKEGKQYIEQKDKAIKVFKIAIRHISGKARR